MSLNLLNFTPFEFLEIIVHAISFGILFHSFVEILFHFLGENIEQK